ncbi:MAG: prepilin-type N-terminal cleavage/methylation domain-containing protein [Spirochaetales bacterium]|nr:prepilin-type N-terminal cleavage/methylation domain-containing protein [Spirochaetales bacterium]
MKTMQRIKGLTCRNSSVRRRGMADSRNAGYTLVETITAIAVLSIALMAAAAGAGALFRRGLAFTGRLNGHLSAYHFSRALDSAVAGIDSACWNPVFASESPAGTRAEIEWTENSGPHRLSVEHDGTALIITRTDPAESSILFALDRVDQARIRIISPAGTVTGIMVEASIAADTGRVFTMAGYLPERFLSYTGAAE